MSLIDSIYLPRASARTPYARPVGWQHGESGYDAPDMRAAPARPGALRASGHPSRTSNRLKWPDGRVTDLQGLAVPAISPINHLE